MNYRDNSERERLLKEINLMDFVIFEMNEYLDTHPYDKEAIEYFQHYNRMKNQAMKDYASKFGPLSLSVVDCTNSNEWEWALQPMPWEGGC